MGYSTSCLRYLRVGASFLFEIQKIREVVSKADKEALMIGAWKQELLAKWIIGVI